MTDTVTHTDTFSDEKKKTIKQETSSGSEKEMWQLCGKIHKQLRVHDGNLIFGLNVISILRENTTLTVTVCPFSQSWEAPSWSMVF